MNTENPNLVPIYNLVRESLSLANRVAGLTSYLPYWAEDFTESVYYKESPDSSTLWSLTLLQDYKVSDLFTADVEVNSLQFKLIMTMDKVPLYKLTINTDIVLVNNRPAYTSKNVVSTGGADLLILPHLHEAASKAIKLAKGKVKTIEDRKNKVVEQMDSAICVKYGGESFLMYADEI